MSQDPPPRPPRRSRPSLADVARRAGVAAITASRVANQDEAVRPETRSRVLAAMTELGYRPNAAARALATGRFRVIGLASTSLTTWGNARTVAAIIAAADRRGYAVVLERAHEATSDEMEDAVARLRSHAVDGAIVLVGSSVGRRHTVAVPEGLPLVMIDAGGDTTHPALDSDQEAGARMAVDHLLDLGHTTVHHVAGPDHTFAARARRRAWQERLIERGAEPPPVVVGDWSSGSGHRAGRELAADPSVTAVFAANDLMAIGVLRAMHEAGRSVPDQISVVGYDDMDGVGDLWPPLTTIRQDFERLGEAAVDLVLGQVDSSADRVPTIIGVDLVERSSTASPPQDR